MKLFKHERVMYNIFINQIKMSPSSVTMIIIYIYLYIFNTYICFKKLGFKYFAAILWSFYTKKTMIVMDGAYFTPCICLFHFIYGTL